MIHVNYFGRFGQGVLVVNTNVQFYFCFNKNKLWFSFFGGRYSPNNYSCTKQVLFVQSFNMGSDTSNEVYDQKKTIIGGNTEIWSWEHFTSPDGIMFRMIDTFQIITR